MKRFTFAALALLGLAACDEPLRPTDVTHPGGTPEVVSGASMTDLGTLGGVESHAYGINNAGQVAGYSDDAGGSYFAFRWSAGSGMQSLGTIPGGAFSYGFAINENGDVAGVALDGAFTPVAFLWTQAGGMISLGTLPGGADSYAFALNDNQQVVGYATTAGGESHAFSWTQGGGMVDLGTLGGTSSQATGVNSAGVVVGYSETAGGDTHAFSWTQGGGMVDLGVPAGMVNSYAKAINFDGVIAGYAEQWLGSGNVIKRDANGTFQDLGKVQTLQNVANGINAVGDLAGHFQIRDTNNFHAFIWTQDGGFVDLGTLGGSNSYAQDVNDDAYVVGESETAAAQTHAVLWTVTLAPNSPPVAQIVAADDVEEGAATLFDGSTSYDPDGAGIIAYEWNFGDGATGTGRNVYHAYADQGTYTVTLIVTDFGGTQHSTTHTVVVGNAYPSLNTATEYMVVPGGTLTTRSTFHDNGLGDGPWTYSIDWGNGSVTNGTTSNQGAAIVSSRLYATAGSYPVSMTITDKDGASATRTFTVTVRADPSSITGVADILPGVTPNNVSRSAPTPLITPVLLKGSSRFDVSNIDPASIWFGTASSGFVRPVQNAATCGGNCAVIADSNGDGYQDLLVYVDTRNFYGQSGSTYTIAIWASQSAGSTIKFSDSMTFTP